MPKQVTLKRSGNVDLWAVRIDQRDIHFHDDTFVQVLPPGHHVIQWFVRGGDGSSYTIEATEPAEAVFKYSNTLDTSEKDAAHVWITVLQ